VQARRALPIALGASLALAALTAGTAALAQQAARPTPSAQASSAAAIDKEKLEDEAPDSPRVSMRTFFDLAERGRFTQAAVYLDLPRGMEKRGPDLATKLYAVLSERLLVDVEQLSPLAQGKPGGGLPEGVEELGRIGDAKNHAVPIRLIRHEAKGADDEARWVFSSATVGHVDAFYATLRDRWMRDHLPAPLLMDGPLSVSWWQWLAIPLLAALCVGPGRLLAWTGGRAARALLGKMPWGAPLVLRLERPTTFGWALALFVSLTPMLALTLRGQDFMNRGTRALAYLIFFWALLRAVVVIGQEIAAGDWARTHPSGRSLSEVGVKLGKLVVAVLALMVALSELGYPVTSVVAGLGIGGVALALAAQKTVENLFGSVSILADQPFRIGDIVRVDSIEGTVESIGLRSTRLRTVDRTLVVFPNGKLADMRIETLGARDRIRFATKLQLSRGVPPSVIKSVVTQLSEHVAAHPMVREQDVFVHLSGIGEASYDVEVIAPIETLDFNEFARVREALLVLCLDVVEKSGARLAVPTRQLLEPWGRRVEGTS
jgi:MscS family membrane protein